MPYSSDNGKRLVDRAILRLTKQLSDTFFKTNAILDVGAGSGTYSDRYAKNGFLPRETFKWTAIEIWEPYVEKFKLRSKYDEVRISDARKSLAREFIHQIASAKKANSKKEKPDFPTPIPPIYDIVFLGDILEHMSKYDAITLLEHCVSVGQIVIVSIPLGHYPQDEFEGNPYEKHVTDNWTHESVVATFKTDVGEPIFFGREGEIGVYIYSTQENTLVKDILKPQVAVYGICKNEKEFIERSYRSYDEADFIVICDTGSTDGTFERLAALVEDRVVELGHEKSLQRYDDHENRLHTVTDGAMTVARIGVSPWRFDDARNVALALVPEEVDMCVSIDADELMEPGWKELLSAEIEKDIQTGEYHDRCYHRFSSIWNWKDVESGAHPVASEHWHERIHTRKNFMWKLPVHEVLVKMDGTPERVKWLGGLKMLQKPDTTKDRSSYLELLEQALKEDSTRWKLWSFYAGDLITAGRFDDAISANKNAMGCPEADKAHLHTQLSRVYQLKGDLQTAAAEMMNAMVLNPGLREYKVYLAQLYLAAGEVDLARMYLNIARGYTQRATGYTYDPACWDDNFEAICRQAGL